MEHGDFKATFTTDKLFLTSMRGTRMNSQGTVDRGAAGSTTYTGTLTFSDLNQDSYSYVFDVQSASFSWTLIGQTSVSASWPNCIPVECPLPGRFANIILTKFEIVANFGFISRERL